MTENSLVATVLSSTTTLLPVQTTTTTTTNKIGITVLTVPAGKEQCRLPLLDHNEEQHDDNNNNGVDRLTTTRNVLHSTVTKTISTVVSAEDEQENHNLRDLGLSEVIANLRLNDNNSDDNAEKQTYHNQRFAAPDGNATGYNADELRLINQYCTLAPINNFHSRYVGQDPSGLAIGHQQPSAWYHDGSGGDHESSGFYSAGGSAAGGFSADCSPPLSGSAPGGGGSGTNHSGPLDYDTNFDDDFDQQLLKATDPSLPGGRNVTESVEVPSSEHVAEIVGRQGCKIKALRAKTNTYIKTPVRGEDPVFVVTGRLEDVLDAKREIECAAEHFTQIRASRRHSQGGQPAPGHITAYVRVPLRVVGLVVGPKGATIKRIQQDTHTYIITPSREREPVFEVTGLVQNVDMARREIEQHIYQRTGNMPITNTNTSLSQYDLDAVVAQHVHTVNGVGQPAVNRPNYGALAAGSAVATTVSDSYADYQRKQQQQQWQALDCQTTTYGGSAAYANGAALSLDGFHNAGSASNQRKALFTQSCPVSAATQQHSQSNIFSGYGGPPAPRHVADDSNWGFNDQSYQPWSDIDLGFPNNFLSNNKINNNNNDYFSTSETLSALAIGGPCGLTSVNSTSRDEGLGDSPINSLGKQHGDMFTQRSFSIWSTQIESIGLAIGVGHREKLAAGGGAPTPQTQFATA